MGQWLIDIGFDTFLGVVLLLGLGWFVISQLIKDEEEGESSVIGKRARDEDGRFIADDPSTPENEAYIGGKKPRKSLKSKKKTD